jgi:hypothetical protein
MCHGQIVQGTLLLGLLACDDCRRTVGHGYLVRTKKLGEVVMRRLCSDCYSTAISE